MIMTVFRFRRHTTIIAKPNEGGSFRTLWTSMCKQKLRRPPKLTEREKRNFSHQLSTEREESNVRKPQCEGSQCKTITRGIPRIRSSVRP